MLNNLFKTKTARPVSSAFRVFQVILIILMQLGGAIQGVQPALAVGGDFKTTDFAAAAPFTYDHTTGGGAYNNRTIGELNDVTEQLEGAQFTCRDIVSYLVQIEMEDTVVEPNQSVQLSFTFLANSTGQAGAAHSEVVGVEVNYGQVENGDNGTGVNPGAGSFGLDSGINDDGGSTVSIVSTGLSGPLFQAGSELLLTVLVDDLEAGESVVLRIDTRLVCNPGSNPTGNLQGQLADVIALPSGDAAGSGAQTIPFLRVGDITGAGEPVLLIEKTVTTADGVCPGYELLSANEGDTVKYCYVITNSGTADLFDLVLVDDNGTPGNIADDFTITLSGLANLDGQTDALDLASGGTATGSSLVTLNASGTVTNVATAIGNNNKSGGNYEVLTNSNDATVTVNDVPSAIEIIKTASPIEVYEPGGDVTFAFTINNLSAVDTVTINSLTDTIYGNLNGVGDCSVPQTLAVSGSYSCSFTAPVSGLEGDVHTNVVAASGVDDDGGPVSDNDDATVTIIAPSVPAPDITLTKTAVPTSVDEPGGDVTFTILVVNNSISDATLDQLDDSIYGELNGQGDCSVPQLLAANGGNYSCSFTTFVSGNAGDVHTNVATALASNAGGSDSAFDDATVTINNVPSAIEIIKTASPTSVDEPGADVTFSFTVNNLSAADAVTINSLTDSIYGDLDGQGDCSVSQKIPAGGSYTCSFTIFVDATETNVVTASGLDDDGNPVSASDDATVTINDVPSSILTTKSASPSFVPETGGDVTYTITVENTSAVDTVTINSVIDSAFGDVSSFCAPVLPADLLPGESVSCSFTEFISGDAGQTHTNIATATGVDDDGNPVSDDDQEEVPFEDVLPDISITKSASPSSVPETGGDVTFTFLVINNSLEAATLDSLVDNTFGDLNSQGDCVLPQPLAANGGSYSCSITVFLSADDLAPHTNVVTATASDDDGNTDTETDDETVSFTDVAPEISLTKSASPSSVPETGGDVTFTFLVQNIGQEDVSLTSLSDSVFGDLNGQGDCAIGGLIAIGNSYSCSISVFLSADDLADHFNVATATAVDDDNNPAQASDNETVGFIDALPNVTISKTANPISVTEPGANVEFTIVVTNNSLEDATIDSLVDSDFDLAANCSDAVGTVLAYNTGYTCVFTEYVAGNVGEDHQNTATVIASDNDGNSDTESDNADVTIENAAPAVSIVKDGPVSLNEGGDSATYGITITNNSVSTDPLTVTSLLDDKFGDLLVEAEAARGGTIVLNPGDSFTFQITRSLELNVGDLHTNVVTVVGVDDEGAQATDNDDHTVTFEDVAPVIRLTKTADQTQVFAPGEEVTFMILIENNSVSTDPVTINNLSDSIYGDLNGQGDCSVPQTIPAGASYSCSFTKFVNSDETNVATASGADDEGTPVSDSDDATVDMINPSIAIEKSTNSFDADAAPGPEILTGEAVTWEYLVTNDGDVNLTNITVTDDMLGNVCTIDVLAAGDSTSCTMTASAEADQYSNTGSASVSYTDADGDAATRSDTDDSHYFGAQPSLSIDKTTADAFGNEGDALGILPGETVTWNYLVTNDGNVALENVGVTDDQGVTVVCPQSTLAVGDSMTCTASGLALLGWYNNVGTTSSVYNDNVGNSATVTDSDGSSYYGLTPGAVTNSQLCDFGDQFRLIFTPDMSRFSSSTPYYKLSDSNPGQTFYNLFYVNDGSTDTLSMEIPYPYVTQGAKPVHVYGGLFVNESGGFNCFNPTNELAAYGYTFGLGDYTDTNGDGVTGYGDVYLVEVPAELGFQYINIHLDYGLEKTDGWLKKGTNATSDGTGKNPAPNGLSINDNTAHTFNAFADGVLIAGSTDTVYNLNEFKQVRGFGGLVNSAVTLDPVEGAQVQLFDSRGNLLETMTTDGDGWYLSDYIHKGKAVTYTLKLVSTGETIAVEVGGKIKFGEGSFLAL